MKPMIVNAPDVTPAAPKPAKARPTIKHVEFGATAHSKLPSSNMAMAIKNQILREKYRYSFPHIDWKPPKVMKYAEPYQATSLRSLNSSVIFGIAVETIVCDSGQLTAVRQVFLELTLSIEMRNVESMTAPMMARKATPLGY